MSITITPNLGQKKKKKEKQQNKTTMYSFLENLENKNIVYNKNCDKYTQCVFRWY